MEHVRSPYDPVEFAALLQRAERNLRSVQNEVRAIVREALQRDGLLRQPEQRQPAGVDR